MQTPTREEFIAAANDGNTVPLRCRVPADLETPVSAFLKLRAGRRGTTEMFLLESVERGIQVGRYSFIGVAPAAVITLRNDVVEIVRGEARGARDTHAVEDDDPLDIVRREIASTPTIKGFDLPGPFAGAVGYVSYEMARYFEKLPAPDDPGLGLPDFRFMIPRTLVVFDHVRSEIEIAVLPAGSDADAYDSARAEIDALLAALDAPLQHGRGNGGASTAAETASNVTHERFESMVGKAKEHILAGDAFQVVLSQRLGATTTTEPFQIYRALRILNPSPYMFFLDFNDFQMIGSSPEVLVKLEGRKATVAPIAGTRPRGETQTQDHDLETELLADEKERAEHVMLVDLGRNDLGRVCDTGTVNVDSLMHIEKYSHVMHIVSTVSGDLREEFDAFDLMRACFPAGTLSGAPKIRAMEIISELEPDRRGPYGGAVGYFGHDGDMDMCITIRTIVMMGERYFVQAGAGIVADSDPSREFEETLNKARALVRAVEIAEEGL
jgi:anthranilate synthase component 1